MFRLRPVIIACIFYLFVSGVFNYQILCNAFFYCVESHPSDGIITEFISEISREKILQFENPYGFHQRLFYPFYTSYALADPGSAHLPFYLVFREFMSSHRTLLLIVFVNLFLNYAVMYGLLRKLNMDFLVSLLGGLVFGAMPFISYRVLNHYTYTPIFLFPLLFLVLYSLVQASSLKMKVWFSAIVAVVGVYTLLTNFYYFISMGIATCAYSTYAGIFHSKKFWQILKNNIWYLLLAGVLFMLLLIPWIMSVLTIGQLYTDAKMQGFGGAWLLSSDLMNVFLPSEHNPFYAVIFSLLSQKHIFLQKVQEMYLSSYAKNAYAGIISLATIAGIFFAWKKVPSHIRPQVCMYISLALFFLSLSFGPFLQIFKRWFVDVEGVSVVLPMPFLLLHYLPGMDTLRAPSRFVPVYIFFLVLASAYVWNYLSGRLPVGKSRYYIIGAVFFVVLLDQLYIIPKAAKEYRTHIPMRLYEHIATDKTRSTVLQIPFTVRDGFSYRGNVHAVSPMKGTLTHGKPIIGGYVARVATEIFSYYDRLPFISYLTRVSDIGNSSDGTPIPKKIGRYVGTPQSIKAELDFLNIRHIILKNDESYSKAVSMDILSAGFKKVSTDAEYLLYSRPLSPREYTMVDFTKEQPAYYLGTTDVNTKAVGHQFDKSAKVFLHAKKSKKQMIIRISAPQEVQADIFVNGQYQQTVTLSPVKETLKVMTKNELVSGIHMIDLVLKNPVHGMQASVYTIELI